MAKTEIQKNIIVKLSLTEAEAKWLKNYIQNDLSGNETSEQSAYRAAIYRELSDV